MSYLKYLENRQHETGSFPLAYYLVDMNDPLYVMSPHWHKETELLYVRSGVLHLSVNGVVCHVCEGEVCYIPDGCLHSGVPSNCVYECIDFDLNARQLQIPMMRNTISKIHDGGGNVFLHFTHEHPRMLTCVERLFGNIQKGGDGWEILAIAGLLEVHGIVLQMHYYDEKSLGLQKVVRLKSVLQYIDENYSRSISLKELSRIAGMCPQHFCRIFREIIKQTPIDYINDFRIEKACELLSEGGKSITEIAYQCGFNDSCYFTRCFKRYKNTTPKQYMKANSQMWKQKS